MSDETTHPPDHTGDLGHGNGEDGRLYGVLAEYDTPGELVEAARKVRDAGYTEFDCYSPFPVHGIDEAMGIKRTILPVLIFGGGGTGTIGGAPLQWGGHAHKRAGENSRKPPGVVPAHAPIAVRSENFFAGVTRLFRGGG